MATDEHGYTLDQPKTTQYIPPPAPYRYRGQEREQRQGPAVVVVPGGGMGGGGVVSHAAPQERIGDRFEAEWRASEKRAERLRQHWEGSRAWTASPQDYEDVVGPNRSGGLEKVASGRRQTGLRKDQGWDGGPSPVRATPNGGNGNGLSGGPAKVPTTVGSP